MSVCRYRACVYYDVSTKQEGGGRENSREHERKRGGLFGSHTDAREKFAVPKQLFWQAMAQEQSGLGSCLHCATTKHHRHRQ